MVGDSVCKWPLASFSGTLQRPGQICVLDTSKVLLRKLTFTVDWNGCLKVEFLILELCSKVERASGEDDL